MNPQAARVFADIAVSLGCATMAIRDVTTGHMFWAGALAVVAAFNGVAAYVDVRALILRRPS